MIDYLNLEILDTFIMYPIINCYLTNHIDNYYITIVLEIFEWKSIFEIHYRNDSKYTNVWNIEHYGCTINKYNFKLTDTVGNLGLINLIKEVEDQIMIMQMLQ
jgi:hypothetical protein